MKKGPKAGYTRAGRSEVQSQGSYLDKSDYRQSSVSLPWGGGGGWLEGWGIGGTVVVPVAWGGVGVGAGMGWGESRWGKARIPTQKGLLLAAAPLRDPWKSE